jgi:DDE superfamily endonuclease
VLPPVTVPPSLAALLAPLRACFTAPGFATFCALAAGMLGGTGPRTVCAMLVGAGLSRAWPHDRAHRFFSHAAWSAEAVGLALARLVVDLLVPDGPVTLAVDDTLYRRAGKKVWAAGFFHDGSATGDRQVGYGNTWVVVGVVANLPMSRRPVCLPVTARLVRKNTTSASRLWLATQTVAALARSLPGRRFHMVADGAYAGAELAGLPANVTCTTRVRRNATLHALPPPRAGRRGRPRLKGNQLPKLEQLAASLAFTPATVTRYGTTSTAYVATLRCLWYTVFGSRPVTVTLVRNRPGVPRGGYDIALVTTGTASADGTDTATATRAVESYASRWSEEVAIRDSKQIIGVGQARNRTKGAVERTVPFGLFCQTLLVLWYATAGHHPGDAAGHRERAPWHAGKATSSTADMLAKLRRVLIAARFRAGEVPELTPAETHAIQLAWETEAA